MYRLLLACLGAAVAGPALADDEPATASQPDEVPAISGSLAVGSLTATGNTESESTSIDAAVAFDYVSWRHSLEFAGYRASEGGTETAERYNASGQSNYRLSERSYLFIRASWLSDRFGPFDRQATLTGGYGRRVLEGATTSLDLEAGGGRRVSEPDGTNDRNHESIVRLNGVFEWAFADNGSFHQAIEIEVGEDNTVSRSVSTIRSQLVGDLALRVSHELFHNSDVPAGSEKTDSLTSIAVEYVF